jgi:hypothetical protein
MLMQLGLSGLFQAIGAHDGKSDALLKKLSMAGSLPAH